MKKIGLATFALALFAAVPAFAAGSANTSVAVSASIANNCTISNAAVALGAYDPIVTNLSSPLNGSGTVTITCTKGAVTNVSIGLGTHASATQRRLSDGAGTPSFMNYELYQPPDNTPGTACSYSSPVVWGTAGANLFTPAAAPSKAARTYNICGQAAGGQDLPAGSYTDTVSAVVNF
jgi:spore coat protein U-like protein